MTNGNGELFPTYLPPRPPPLTKTIIIIIIIAAAEAGATLCICTTMLCYRERFHGDILGEGRGRPPLCSDLRGTGPNFKDFTSASAASASAALPRSSSCHANFPAEKGGKKCRIIRSSHQSCSAAAAAAASEEIAPHKGLSQKSDHPRSDAPRAKANSRLDEEEEEEEETCKFNSRSDDRRPDNHQSPLCSSWQQMEKGESSILLRATLRSFSAVV